MENRHLTQITPPARHLLSAAMAFCLTVVCIAEPVSQNNTFNPMPAPRFMVGVDNAGESMVGTKSGHQPPSSVDGWWKGLDLLGAEFISYHSWYNDWLLKDVETQIANARRLCGEMERRNRKFLLNLEIANWREHMIDPGGHDWVKRPNGTHGFTFRPEVLAVFNESPAFLGVIYDEIGHMLINRNRFIIKGAKGDAPLFVETTGSATVEEAHDKFVAAAGAYVKELKQARVRQVVSEHAFPIIHPFAEAGFTVAPKLLKESWTPVVMALGIGAALQYERELWILADLWDITVENYPKTFPGHNPRKLASAMRVAYHMGADALYVENYNFKDALAKLTPDSAELTAYGEEVARFNKEYLPATPRPYSFRDVRPEVAIIRMDDTDFGLANNFWKDQLHGAKNLHANARTKNWMKAVHLLSHEVIPHQAVDWNARHVYENKGKHILFAPFNNVVVFDHKVGARHLETLKLAFLTGLAVSPETLAALEEKVAKGLVVIADPELVRADLRQHFTGETTVIAEGSGRWVLTSDFLDARVRATVQPFLGPKERIRYVFGDSEVIFEGAPGRDDIEIRVAGNP